MFYSANLNTGISFNSENDSPQIIDDAWRDCNCSLATLVYIDNDRLNIYDRSLEQLALVWT